jgi:putative nucleotidyltransferase with HDIG domain
VSVALDAARAALRDERVWLVGGAVRDRLLSRTVDDIDLVVDGDVKAAARHLALAVGGPAFPLSDAHGAWRVIGPARSWQVDLSPLRGGHIDADLGHRDFTINAIAEPLQGGALIDPTGGAQDALRRRLRMVSEDAFTDDPLRVLRLARFAAELGLEADAETTGAARRHAAGIDRVAAERVFAELRRIVACRWAVDGLLLVGDLGLEERILPELHAMRGVEQNAYHDTDVHTHTLGVLQATIDLEDDPTVLGEGPHVAVIQTLLAEPFSDELRRGTALRFGALLHDAAKPQTQARRADGAIVGFPGHDEAGARIAREVLTRLRTSDRLRTHVAALARHHLRLGYLVHRRPLTARLLHAYLHTTGPVALDVTLLSVADRLATTGRNAEEATVAHLDLAREMLPAVLAWERTGPAEPLVRGDELGKALELEPSPLLGELLAELASAQYAQEISTVDEAIAHARTWLADRR